VDSITHALLVTALLTVIGAPVLIPFGILGTVILDADILFHLYSSKRPTLYMFIHGGAAHSIAGAAIMAASAYGIFYFFILAIENISHFTSLVTFNQLAFLAVIGGAMLHILLDFLASPGIPLFWPWKDTKYTMGIFAGPSAVMIAISWTFIILFILGVVQISGLIFYGILFLAYLGISVLIRIAAAIKIEGKTHPTINPFKWLVIEKFQNTWSLKFVNILTGYESGNRTWPAFVGVTKEDMDQVSQIPAVRRVKYHSIFTIIKLQDNGDILILDPSRAEGIIRYPPYYTSIILKKTDMATWEVVAGN